MINKRLALFKVGVYLYCSSVFFSHTDVTCNFKPTFMTSKLFLTFLTAFSLTAVFAQEKIWTKQTKISEVIAFEKGIDSKAKFLFQNVSLSKNYYPLADKYIVVNPIIVQREPLEYLPIYAEYYFTPGVTFKIGIV